MISTLQSHKDLLQVHVITMSKENYVDPILWKIERGVFDYVSTTTHLPIHHKVIFIDF